MTVSEMHINVRVLLDKLDTASVPNVDPEIIDIFLNRAQRRIVKQRMSGLNVHRTSFEETQKRTDDLRVLVTDKVITPSAISAENKPYARFFTLPATVGQEYWFSVNEEAEVVYQDCKSENVTSGNLVADTIYLVNKGSVTYNSVEYTAPAFFTATSGYYTFTGTGLVYTASSKRVEVKPLSHDNYNKAIKDPFNKPDINQVRRLSYGNSVELIGAETFALRYYYLRYIRRPIDISLNPVVNCELSEHLHDEIVDMAVSLLLEDIESGRYQTNLNELVKQE